MPSSTLNQDLNSDKDDNLDLISNSILLQVNLSESEGGLTCSVVARDDYIKVFQLPNKNLYQQATLVIKYPFSKVCWANELTRDENRIKPTFRVDRYYAYIESTNSSTPGEYMRFVFGINYSRVCPSFIKYEFLLYN